MKLSRRQQQIMDWMQHDGYFSIEALAEKCDVATQTIRRDINTLCETGLLMRYHGGAGLPQSSVKNVAYSARQELLHDEKIGIAELVARRIPDDASLFINIGTTNEEVAKALLNHKGLRVITNNLNVARILCGGSNDCVVTITGGQVRQDCGVIGETAAEFIRQFKTDYAIIGVSGIEENGALRDFDAREVRVSRTIIQQARTVFLVADHSKFGRVALVELGHVSDIDALFTDRPLPPELAAILAEANTEVCIVASESASHAADANKHPNPQDEHNRTLREP